MENNYPDVPDEPVDVQKSPVLERVLHHIVKHPPKCLTFKYYSRVVGTADPTMTQKLYITLTIPTYDYKLAMDYNDWRCGIILHRFQAEIWEFQGVLTVTYRVVRHSEADSIIGRQREIIISPFDKGWLPRLAERVLNSLLFASQPEPAGDEYGCPGMYA